MHSMTYGVMPTQEQFQAAFDQECPKGVYRIRNLSVSDSVAVADFQLGDGDWTALQLWEAINEIDHFQPGAEEGLQRRHDSAMDLVSSILDTLGFEWI